MHVANVIDVYASRDTPFALIFRTYPADPFTPPPLCILPFFILSKGTDGVSVENGNMERGGREAGAPVAQHICCRVLRVSVIWCACKEDRAYTFTLRSNGPDDEGKRDRFLPSFLSSFSCICDTRYTRPRLLSFCPAAINSIFHSGMSGTRHRWVIFWSSVSSSCV